MSNPSDPSERNDSPLIQVSSFEDYPLIHENLQREVPNCLANTFWRFPENADLKTPRAISQLICGIIASRPEWSGITMGSTIFDFLDTHQEPLRHVGALAIVVPYNVLDTGTALVEPLVEATNQQLVHIGSFYQLPLE